MNPNYILPSKSALSLPKIKVPEHYHSKSIATPNMDNNSLMPALLPPLIKLPTTPPQLPYNQQWSEDTNRQQLPSLKHFPFTDFQSLQHQPQLPQHAEYYPPPQSYYFHQPPQPQYYATYQVKQQGHTHHTILSSSREIKRRTKTGCLTCRKRRIKCDERHPTCSNCDKSKRVCLGYDPLFTLAHNRKASTSLSDSPKHSQPQGAPPTPEMTPQSPKSDSTTLASVTTPRASQCFMNTQPAVRYPESCSKMNINSLLDAAAVIEEKTSSCKRKASSAGVDEQEPSAARAPKKVCTATLDDRSCDSWDDVERVFTDDIAGFLDNLFATDRFSQIKILGKAKVCGLPLEGGDSINIPIGGSINSSNGTVRVGQDIATLEAVRHLLSILCPSFYLDILSIDDASVGKLEELRISSDYKLLRAVVQLMTASKNTQFLPVDDKDDEIFQRIQALHRFMTGDEQQQPLPYRSTPAPEHQYQLSEVLARGLCNATPTELWSVMIKLAQEPVQLAPADEDALVKLAQSNSSDAALRVPLLLTANHYLLTRKPQRLLVAGKDNSLKLLLHESSSSGMNGNVVARRLVNMAIN